MENGFTKEFMRVTGGQLKTEFRVEPTIPLEIKLWVERLRLAELIRGSAAHSPSVCSKPAEGFHCKRRGGEQASGPFQVLGRSIFLETLIQGPEELDCRLVMACSGGHPHQVIHDP